MTAKRNMLFRIAIGFALSTFVGMTSSHAGSLNDKMHPHELSRVPSQNAPIGKNELVVTIKFRLNRSGYIEGMPTATARGGTKEQQEREKKTAVKAVVRSQPFKLPAEKYDLWSNVELTFYPECPE
ncbi:TPA: hypothetical protein IHM15_004429 [Escherichia coli]|nr:hypothetical protein [Escherichia coli]